MKTCQTVPAYCVFIVYLRLVYLLSCRAHNFGILAKLKRTAKPSRRESFKNLISTAMFPYLNTTGSRQYVCSGGSKDQVNNLSRSGDEFDDAIAQILVGNAGFQSLPVNLRSMEHLFLSEPSEMTPTGIGYIQQKTTSFQTTNKHPESNIQQDQHIPMTQQQQQRLVSIPEQQNTLLPQLLQAHQQSQVTSTMPNSSNRDDDECQGELEKPKRSLSAYNFFFQNQRRVLLKTLPTRNGKKPRNSHGKIGFADMARTIAAKWKRITPEEKTEYNELAEMDSIRYKQELAIYNRQKEEAALQRRLMGVQSQSNRGVEYQHAGPDDHIQPTWMGSVSKTQGLTSHDQPSTQLVQSQTHCHGPSGGDVRQFGTRLGSMQASQTGNLGMPCQTVVHSQSNPVRMRSNSLCSLPTIASQSSLGTMTFPSVDFSENCANATFPSNPHVNH